MAATTNSPMTWGEIADAVPALADLLKEVERSSPPTTMPEHGAHYNALIDRVEELARPLGSAVFGVARDRLHAAFHAAVCRAANAGRDD